MSDNYAELYAQRQQEWALAQAKAQANLEEQQKALLAMPDVKHAPEVDQKWGSPRVVHPCGNTTYLVRRWVLVNGQRHRAELFCLQCERADTWDWGEGRWLL